MSPLSTVVLEAQLPCTHCTLWRMKYHVVTIHGPSNVGRRYEDINVYLETC